MARSTSAIDVTPASTLRAPSMPMPRRVPDEVAAEFQRRLEELALEFGSVPTGGETRYGLVVGIFATDHPTVTEEIE